MCASKKSFIINKFLIIKFLFNNETLYLGDLNHYNFIKIKIIINLCEIFEIHAYCVSFIIHFIK